MQLNTVVCLIFAIATFPGTGVSENTAREFVTFTHFRSPAEGSDMETIYDELRQPNTVAELLESAGFGPEVTGAISWIAAGSATQCTLVFKQPNPDLDTAVLRENVRRYVESRRTGLTKEFVLARLTPQKGNPQPDSPAAAAITLARNFLPGVRDGDLKPLAEYPASFPKGALPLMNLDQKRCLVMEDKVVSRIFIMSEDANTVFYSCWISSLDLRDLRKPEVNKIVGETVDYVSKTTGENPGSRGWLGGYWLILDKRLKDENITWHSPQALNSGHIFD
jgi:hypothetical protein